MFKSFLVTLLILQVFTLKAQNVEALHDTTKNYLFKMCFELLKPHSDLTFSFGTDELSNQKPDMSVNLPALKDTSKYFNDLKGDYTDWYLFYKIGDLYQKFKFPDQAMSYYNQAYNLIYSEILKDTLKAEPFSAMASLYLNLNSNENAFYFFNRAYELNPKDSNAVLFLPMFYISRGEYAKAQELVKKSRVDFPQNTGLYIWLLTSEIYKTISSLKQGDQAFTNKSIDELFDFKEINDIAKKNKNDIRFTLVEILGRQLAVLAKYSMAGGDFTSTSLNATDLKELKSIRKKLETIIEKKQFNNNYVIYKALGFNYLFDKNTAKAIDYFYKTIAAWPPAKSSKDYYLIFTVQYFLKNDTVAALKLLDEKISSDKKNQIHNPSDDVLKGHIYLNKRDFTSANEAYRSALELQQLPDAYLGMAVPFILNGNLGEANQWINKAYELNKDYYLTYALFGIITMLNNQKEEAKSAFQMALKLKPDDPEIKELLETFFSK